MDSYLYGTFPVCWPLKATLQHLSVSPIHTHIHTLLAEAAMQGANCSSGAIWGSVSCSGSLRHAARRSRDSNQRQLKRDVSRSFYCLITPQTWAVVSPLNTPVFKFGTNIYLNDELVLFQWSEVNLNVSTRHTFLANLYDNYQLVCV